MKKEIEKEKKIKDILRIGCNLCCIKQQNTLERKFLLWWPLPPYIENVVLFWNLTQAGKFINNASGTFPFLKKQGQKVSCVFS